MFRRQHQASAPSPRPEPNPVDVALVEKLTERTLTDDLTWTARVDPLSLYCVPQHNYSAKVGDATVSLSHIEPLPSIGNGLVSRKLDAHVAAENLRAAVHAQAARLSERLVADAAAVLGLPSSGE